MAFSKIGNVVSVRRRLADRKAAKDAQDAAEVESLVRWFDSLREDKEILDDSRERAR